MRNAPDAPALTQAREVIGLFLPGNAANRVLERALAEAGLTPADVDGRRMAELLVGPIYRDLRDVVPRAALRREFGGLARRLRQSGQDDTGSTHNDAGPRVSAAVEPTTAEAATSDAPTTTPEPSAAEPTPAAAAATAPAPEVSPMQVPVPGRPLDPEAVLVALAQLDGVAGAAVFDVRGRADSVRGEVPEVASLGPVIAASGALLERHGALRSLFVTTTAGAVLAVPIPPRWLAVSGPPDMNLGAVYAALTALEEER